MENNNLAYLVIIVVVLVFGALIAIHLTHSGIYGNYNNYTSNNRNMIVITATGAASNSSSQAQMYVTINGTGSTNAAAVQNLSNALNTFNSTIVKYVNGNLSDVTTSNFNVYRIYNTSNFMASEDLTIIIPQIKNVGAAILALSSIPNVYVTSANPILSANQTTLLRSKALSNALANATAQAKALIPSNQSIYSTNITVDDYYFYPLYGSASGASVNSTGSLPPQFYSGTNQVVERVTVTFYYGRVVKPIIR
ncbi:MAG: SIMPL domain-containing protein [Candidatus Micrarchaeaceae archaeon]|jgi:uncharacterized protein YggE